MSPILLCASVCSQRLLHVVGGCKGPLTCWTPPLHLPCIGVPPLQFTLSTYLLASLCISMFRGYLYVIGGIFPLCWGCGGVPHLLGVLGASSHGVSICLFLYILVVHYVLHFYYGYDYYSSSYTGVFCAVICFISDHGFFLDGASINVGSVWSGSTTTLDAERLWRCYWPCLCAIAATSIFDASSGLCQLCYWFSTGRFLFQSWASHHFVYYMFGVHSDVCFLLLDAELDAVFTYGGSTIWVCTFATLWSLPMAGICATWWWSLVHAWYV